MSCELSVCCLFVCCSLHDNSGKSTLSFILVVNQLDAQNLFYSKFISCVCMFRAPRAHRQEVKNCIIQPLVSSHSTGGRPVHGTATY